MKTHDLETRPQAALRLLRQVEEEEDKKPEAEGMLSRHYDPFAQLSAQTGLASDINAQNSVLRRTITGRSSHAECSILRLQRTHGNRYTRELIARATEGSGPTEVAPEVEQAIQTARGGGQPLDSVARAQMEQAIGADFSGVRVHTGTQADALNRNLSARAFTTGEDIFFKQGEYSPGSSTGRELLAHELTHVVQQNGDQVQTKLTLGQPGDRYEQEADQVAQAVLRQATNEVNHSRLPVDEKKKMWTRQERIQRRREEIPARHWGRAPTGTSDSNVWFNPHVELWVGGRRISSDWFPRGRSTGLTLTTGTTGVIRIQVDTGWFQDNILFNYSGSAVALVDVPFSVSPQGELRLQEPDHNSESGGDAAELVMPVTVTSGTNDQGGFIRISPIIRSEGSSTATASFGAEEVVGGQLGGEETTSRTQSWQRTFTVNLIVPSPRTRRVIYTTNAHFAVNSDRVEAGTEEFVARWFLGLPEDVKRRVRDGSMPIELNGHASTTGSVDNNRRLSQRRVARVREILADVAGSRAQIHTASLGEYQASTANEVEDERERRVEISVTGEETISAAE